MATSSCATVCRRTYGQRRYLLLYFYPRMDQRTKVFPKFTKSGSRTQDTDAPSCSLCPQGFGIMPPSSKRTTGIQGNCMRCKYARGVDVRKRALLKVSWSPDMRSSPSSSSTQTNANEFARSKTGSAKIKHASLIVYQALRNTTTMAAFRNPLPQYSILVKYYPVHSKIRTHHYYISTSVKTPVQF